MATRCMLSAEYFCSGSVSRDTFGHYGLASPIYTHFTSPIRRYAGKLGGSTRPRKLTTHTCRRPRASSARGGHLARPAAPLAALEIQRGAHHGHDQSAASDGADGGPRERRVLRRAGTQGACGGPRQGGGCREGGRRSYGRRVRHTDVSERGGGVCVSVR